MLQDYVRIIVYDRFSESGPLTHEDKAMAEHYLGELFDYVKKTRGKRVEVRGYPGSRFGEVAESVAKANGYGRESGKPSVIYRVQMGNFGKEFPKWSIKGSAHDENICTIKAFPAYSYHTRDGMKEVPSRIYKIPSGEKRRTVFLKYNILQ